MELPSSTIPGTDIPYTAGERLILDARDEQIRMLHSIPWQWFSTHTINRPMSRLELDTIWPRYLRAANAEHRDTIGLAWSLEEVRANNPCFSLAPHYHCFWVSNKPLDQGLLRNRWMALAGTGNNPVQIEQYDGNPKALKYLLKLSNHPDSDWGLSSNIELFRPTPVTLSTAQARRRYLRFLDRKNKHETAPTQ